MAAAQPTSLALAAVSTRLLSPLQAQEQINDAFWRETQARTELAGLHKQIQALRDARQVLWLKLNTVPGPCM